MNEKYPSDELIMEAYSAEAVSNLVLFTTSLRYVKFIKKI